MAIQFDGTNGTRLRQTASIQLGVGKTFEIFCWSALIRMDDQTAANPAILCRRTAATLHSYDMFWRYGRNVGAADAANDFRRLHYVHDNSVDTATHYQVTEADGFAPQVAAATFQGNGGWFDWARASEVTDVCSGYLAGAESKMKPDTYQVPINAGVVMSIGGLLGSPTTNQAKFTMCNLAIWSVKLTTAQFEALHGITTTDVFKLPMLYPTGLRHFYTLKNLTDGLLDRVGGNHLIADGGVMEVAGPAGVEDYGAITIQPTTGACNDTRLNAASSGTNYGTATTFIVGFNTTGSAINRATIRQDFSNYVPAGATIIAPSTLTLTASANNGAVAQSGTAHRVLAAEELDEAEETWAHRVASLNTNWGGGAGGGAADGGTYVSALAASSDLPTAGDATWVINLIDLLPDAITNRANIVRLLLKRAVEATTTHVVTFHSGDSATAEKRPLWTITYTTPTPSTIPPDGGGSSGAANPLNMMSLIEAA